MGKSKKTKQSQNQNTNFNNQASYGWQQTPDTQDISALRGWQPQTDPGLGHQYANARNKLNNSFLDPMGGYSTPQMRDAQQRTGNRNLNQDEAQAFRSGAYDVNQQKLGQLGTLAGLTAPRLTQTSSSGYGNMTGNSTTTQGDGGAGAISGAMNLASMFIM